MFRKKSAAPLALDATVPNNVTVLHPRITARHTALLARWLAAGQRMGLCDAHAFSPKRNERGLDYVLVWVRENPDPAYMVQSQGTAWVVTDLVRQQALTSQPTFAAALNFIRPVLPLEAAA